jgi:hypothetical protein
MVATLARAICMNLTPSASFDQVPERSLQGRQCFSAAADTRQGAGRLRRIYLPPRQQIMVLQRRFGAPSRDGRR